MKKNLTILNFLISIFGLFFLNIQLSAAENKRELIYAGYAFAGDATTTIKRFPYLLKSIEELNLNEELNKRVLEVKNKNLEIITNDYFSTKINDNRLNLILVMTGETVLLENYGGYWKIFLNLRGEALIFNYKDKSVVKTYPINLAIFDAAIGANKPSDLQIRNLIKKYLIEKKEDGFISQFILKINQATIEEKAQTLRFQVASVNIKPEAESELPIELRGSKEVIQEIIADSFSSELTSKTNVSLIPPKFNNAVMTMTKKLAQIDEQIVLTLKDADYLISISLNKLAKVKKQETTAEVSFLYGASSTIQVKVNTPNSDSALFDATFKNGVVSISPINKISNDDFPAYFDVVNSLFRKFSMSIKNKDYEWAKISSGNEKIGDQIENLSKLIGKGEVK